MHWIDTKWIQLKALKETNTHNLGWTSLPALVSEGRKRGRDIEGKGGKELRMGKNWRWERHGWERRGAGGKRKEREGMNKEGCTWINRWGDPFQISTWLVYTVALKQATGPHCLCNRPQLNKNCGPADQILNSGVPKPSHTFPIWKNSGIWQYTHSFDRSGSTCGLCFFATCQFSSGSDYYVTLEGQKSQIWPYFGEWIPNFTSV